MAHAKIPSPPALRSPVHLDQLLKVQLPFTLDADACSGSPLTLIDLQISRVESDGRLSNLEIPVPHRWVEDLLAVLGQSANFCYGHFQISLSYSVITPTFEERIASKTPQQ